MMARSAIGLLQGMALLALLLLGQQLQFTWPWLLGLATAAGLFGWQQWLIRAREPAACFRAFLNNQWVGLAIFAGLLAHYLLA